MTCPRNPAADSPADSDSAEELHLGEAVAGDADATAAAATARSQSVL